MLGVKGKKQKLQAEPPRSLSVATHRKEAALKDTVLPHGCFILPLRLYPQCQVGAPPLG